MTLRKTGTCKDCKKTLYGDEYGASGHRCEMPLGKSSEAVKESERYANSILRQSGKFVRSDVTFAHYSGIMWLMEQIKEINDESIADAQFYGHHAKAWELEEKLKLLLEPK